MAAAENCYDAAADLVRSAPAGQCAGTVISEDEAARIRQRRVNRIRQAMQVPPSPFPVSPTMRMKSVGTGFFVTRDGILITNDHVVAGCTALTAETSAGLSVPAKDIGHDRSDDLALLKIEQSVPVAAIFRDNDVEEGERVAAIGYPDQGMVSLRPVLAEGALTTARQAQGHQLAFHADVRPGNSGGPLLDGGGLVIGVVFAKIDTVKTYQATGRVVRDVGFAISNQAVARFLRGYHIARATLPPGPGLSMAEVLARSSPFVVRIECWN